MAHHNRLDEDSAFSGFLLGIVAGGLWSFFFGRRIRIQPPSFLQTQDENIRQKFD